MTTSFREGVLKFASDLIGDIALGDADYLSILDEVEDYALRNSLHLLADPEAQIIGPYPACFNDPILELDLTAARVGTIIWATGYTLEFN